MPEATLPLTRLPVKLRELYPASRVPSYMQAYRACLDGKIPSVMDGGRMLVREGDLGLIAEAFGRTVPSGFVAA